jgi:hypothetical protein
MDPEVEPLRKFRIRSDAPDMFRDQLAKAEGTTPASLGATGLIGAQEHPICRHKAYELAKWNATHAISLARKVAATGGLGFRDLSIAKRLDPLTRFGLQAVIDSAIQDRYTTGDGYIETVWRGTALVGIYHIPAKNVWVVLESATQSEHYHYVIVNQTQVYMAKYGGTDALKARMPSLPLAGVEGLRHEIIHLRQPGPHPYYGSIDYESATPLIELSRVHSQAEFSLQANRGVPELLIVGRGQALSAAWDAIEEAFDNTTGVYNRGRSLAIHLPGDPASVDLEVHKLAEPKAANEWTDTASGIDARIATAHGMPPQLANIQIPGKMNGSNELTHAMLLFQTTVISPAQRMIYATLQGPLSLPEVPEKAPTPSPTEPPSKDFFVPGSGFRTILDGMTIDERETMEEMREPVLGSGRKLSAGKLSGQNDRKPGSKGARRGTTK